MSTLSPTAFQCPLCGARFTHGDQACSGCPLASDCDVLQCPYCRYQFPRRSRLAEWLRRMLDARRRTA